MKTILKIVVLSSSPKCEMNFSRLTTITNFSNCVPRFRIMFYSNSIQLTSSVFSLLYMWIVTHLVLHRSIARLMLSPLTLFSAVPNFSAWVITCQLLSLSDNNPRILLVPLCVCVCFYGRLSVFNWPHLARGFLRLGVDLNKYKNKRNKVKRNIYTLYLSKASPW
jgi:hypothetical protein